MKFSVSRDALHEALALTNQAAKSSEDVLSIAAKGTTVTIQGSSGDATLTLDVTAAVATEGSVFVPGRFLQQVVSKIPAKDLVIELNTTSGISVAGGSSSFSVRTYKASPTPAIQLPQVDPITVSGDLIDSMSQVSVAASKGSSAQVALSGVLVSASADQKVDVVATDSYRIAVKSLEASAFPAAARSLIPSGVVELLSRLMASRTNLSVRLGDKSASFHTDGAVLTTRLIADGFPAYEKVIPAAEGTIVTADRDALVDLLQRARLVNDTRVSIAISEDGLTVSSKSVENDTYEEAFAAEVNGDAVAFSVNPVYVIDGLRATASAQVQLVCASPVKPILVQAKDDAAFRYVVMPVRG